VPTPLAVDPSTFNPFIRKLSLSSSFSSVTGSPYTSFIIVEGLLVPMQLMHETCLFPFSYFFYNCLFSSTYLVHYKIRMRQYSSILKHKKHLLRLVNKQVL